MNEKDFLEWCKQEVCDYTNAHLDKSDNVSITTDDDFCGLIKANCRNKQACIYSMGRFGVPVCFPDRQEKTDKIHKEELKARNEILKNGEYSTGNNYIKELDLNYKDAVIDKQAQRKKEY